MSTWFVAHGTPVPQGSIRSLGKGRPSIHSNADRLLPWRFLVQHAAELAHQGPPIDGPVSVALDFGMPRPKSTRKADRWPTRRPDLDKLTRGCLDALTEAGVILDDSQVVDISARKSYAGDVIGLNGAPGVIVRVWAVQSPDA